MKKKIVLSLLSTLIVALIIGFIFLRNLQVLKISGITQSSDIKMVILELKNSGFRDIKLLNVTMNESQIPDRSELGVSYSNRLVIGDGLEEDPNIKFYDNISEIKIKPATNQEEKKLIIQSKKRPTDYGLRIYSKKQIVNVTIKYKYLGLIYRKEVVLENQNK